MSIFNGHATLRNGLLSAFKFDEPSGARFDAWGTNHLANNNGVTSVAGKNGNAASFAAASSQYLSLADSATTVWGEDGNGVSVSVWVKPRGNPIGYAHIFGRDNADGHFAVFLDFNSMASAWLAFNAGTQIEESFATGFSAGNWYHLRASFDPADKKMRIYRNNALIKTSAAGAGASLVAQSSPFVIGKRLGGYANIDVDEMLIYSRPLTSQEGTDLWTGGSGLFLGDPEIARFRFDREGCPAVSRLTNVALMTGQGD